MIQKIIPAFFMQVWMAIFYKGSGSASGRRVVLSPAAKTIIKLHQGKHSITYL
jgi:hypothetical protein